MAENFNLIFGSSASQSYSWNDSDYQNGWQTVGDTPPTREQFDALQRRNDKKAQELKNALTPLVDANTADSRQPATSYDVDTIKYIPSLPTGWYLECTTAGISGTGDIVLPAKIAENATVTDGTVVWTIRKIGSGGDGSAVGDIKAIAYNGTVQAGWLLCDGSAVSRTMFPDLFAAIGTTYGAGDGSTTFNVPDYNAAKRFAQGDTVAGTVKSAGLPNITGSVKGYNTQSGYMEIARTGDGALYPTLDGTGRNTTGDVVGKHTGIAFDASRSSSIYGNSDTVQPPALTARYIIKAFDGQTADSALIDITKYANELAGKANRQLSNLDTANLACHVVVDSHYDSTTGDWYRVYDDGWVEQGGIATVDANSRAIVTLLKPLSDTKYTIACAIDQPAGGQLSYNVAMSVGMNKTTTTFGCGNDNSTLGMVATWAVYGMGANS